MKKIKKIAIILIAIIFIIAVVATAIIIMNLKDKEYELEKIEKYSYFKLYQNEKYGVIDANGNILIDPLYDIVNIPNPTKAVFVCYYDYDDSNGEYKTKTLNDKNEEILTQYEKVLPILCETSTSNVPFEKSVLKYKENGKYGIIDFSGNKITKAIYDSIESLEYREGSLIVEQSGKYGVINIKGKELIKAEFDEVQSDLYYTEQNDYLKAGFIVKNKTQDGYRYGYINKDGKQVLQTEYNEINRVTEINDDENVYLLVSKNGKYGILKNDKLLIASAYEEIEYNKTNQLFIVQKNSKQGVISLEGKQILPVEYDYVLCEKNRITTTKGENVQIYNINGEKQSSQYDNIIETSNENYIITIDDNENFGIVNKNAQELVPNKYQYLEYAYDTYFIATENGKVGVINIADETVIEFKYNIIQKIKDKNAIQAINSSTNTIEIYNNKIENQLSMKNAILYTYSNYIKLLSDNDMQYFDNNGNIISNIELFKENKLYAYKENDKWGFIDENNNVIVQAQYDLVTELNMYGFAGIKKDGKWGIINQEGKIIVEPTYKIDWNDPEFIGKYCKLNFGYGFEYYTDQLTK